MTALGDLLKLHREAARLTQEELAHLAGVSARTISDLERGVRDSTYGPTAARLADAMGLGPRQRAEFANTARGRRARAIDAWPREARAVPRPLTSMLGRDEQLERVVAALTDGSSRLLTLTGPGGIGKTRLALEAAIQAERHFEGATYFVELGPLHDPALVLPTIARAVGAPNRTSVAALADHLSSRRSLVLLDTFEHVVDAASEVGLLLTSCVGLTALVTSREPLHLRGEHEVPLSPLGVPETSAVADALRWPATALFVARAQAASPSLVFDEQASRLIIDICTRLNGVPLAIELAAARVKHLSLSALQGQLAAGVLGMSRGARDLPPRQQTMRATVSWSYNLLSPAEQAVYRDCSVFTGGWTLQAAEAVSRNSGAPGHLLEVLSALVDKSVVFTMSTGDGEFRYDMLDVIREYAAELRDARAEIPGLARRHEEYCVKVAEQTESQLGRQRAWYRYLETEQGNLRAALRSSVGHGEARMALRLAGALWQFWLAHGDLTEGRRWLSRALAIDPSSNFEERAKALWGLGWLAYHQADDAVAERASTELQDIAIQLADPMATRNALTLRGMVQMAHGRHQTARDLLTESLDIARGLNHRWLLATSLLNLGIATMHVGDAVRSRELITEALSSYTEIGDEHFTARCHGYLGYTHLLDGELDAAGELIATSLAMFHDLGERGGIAEGLDALAAVHACAGRADQAAHVAGAAAALRETFDGRGLPFDRATTQRYLHEAEQTLGEGAWQTAWDEGRSMAVDEAIALALA